MLKKGFNIGLILVAFCSQPILAQDEIRLDSLNGIDTAFVREKLIKHIYQNGGRWAGELADLAKTSRNIYIYKTLDDLSSKYEFYTGRVTVNHITKEVSITNTSDIVCVWDIERKVFLDTIDLEKFNKILSSITIPLNSYEKVILYNRIVYQIEPLYYYSKLIRRRKEVDYQTLYEFPINPLLKISPSRHLYKPSLSKDPTLKSIVNCSNNLIFYLPFFNYPRYRSFDNLPIEKVSFQVFYFNPAGHLVHTFWLYDYIEVINKQK